tara:strand:+ start:1232 stop:2407 length:1176 start_codon:yes stop_codon:yes gene_type:complete
MKIYDVLIKNGTLIDPANKINSKMDIAISGTKIAKVSKTIDESTSKLTIDAKSLIICPGLIDIHAHSFGYWESIFPDEMCLPFGTTTMLDAGGPGWKTFDTMKDKVIRKSKTRVFSLLNIVGSGMIMDGEQNVSDMDSDATSQKIKERKDMLVGVKVAHFEANSWEAVKRGKKAAEDSGTFMMVDQNPISGRNMEELLTKYMTSGDILTHVYAWGKPILDRNKKVYDYFFDARKKGILFDLGHGAGSFSFSMAKPAIDQGFLPDTISTDHHRESMLTNHSNMPNCMSKMIALGISLEDVIRKSTLTPSKILNRPDLGHIGEGSEADIAVLKIKEGNFGLIDNGLTGNRKLMSSKIIENQLTIKSGKVVWDKEGISFEDYKFTPSPSYFDIE